MSTPARWNAGALAVVLVVLGLTWVALPDGEIAVHFAWDGEPDAFGTRTELVGVLGGITVAIWLFLTWLSHAAGRLHWSMVNIPRKDHWEKPENMPVARRRLAEDMAVVNVWTMLLLVSTAPVMVLSARRGEMGSALGTGLLVLIGVMTVALLAVIRRRNRFYRDVPEG